MAIPRSATFVPALVAACAVGCGPRNAQITGLVVDGGQPVLARPGAPEPPLVTFVCKEAQLTGTCGLGPTDGRFTVYAPDGRTGLPAGRYKIGFLYGNAKTPKTGTDFSVDESPIELTLEAGQVLEVTIDVGKRTLTK
jgi:hypothetical protein